MPYSYVISPQVYRVIDAYYSNVARKYSHTYSLTLMIQNIENAYKAIYQIENGFPRRTPTTSKWQGLFMATYMVRNKSRWNYAYRIDEETNTIYVEDACHANNMKETQLRDYIFKLVLETIKKESAV